MAIASKHVEMMPQRGTAEHKTGPWVVFQVFVALSKEKNWWSPSIMMLDIVQKDICTDLSPSRSKRSTSSELLRNGACAITHSVDAFHSSGGCVEHMHVTSPGAISPIARLQHFHTLALPSILKNMKFQQGGPT